MDGAMFHRVIRLPAAALALVLAVGAAHAQQMTIAGRVVSESQQPLAGANIGIPELGVGTVAAVDGRYSFTVDLTRARAGRSVALVARFIGYKPARAQITLSGR